MQIAIDAAKSLIAIGIAFFAAIGAFIVQFATSHSSVIAIPIGFLALAGLLAVISMIAGFYAIGDAYNRAENPGSTTAGGPSTPAWSTVPLRTPLNVQSLAGLAALCCFGVAISLWNFGDPSSGIAVKPAVSSATPVGARGTFGLEGVWIKLKVRHGTFSVELDPTPARQVSAFQIELH